MTLGQAIFGLLGLAIGSFLNVVIDRVPVGQSIVKPRSRCISCDRELSPWEMVPVLSYLLLRRRCRTCGETIPLRTVLVEAGTGLLFFLLWDLFDSLAALVLACGFGAALIAVSVIDVEHSRIPNSILYPSIAVGLLAALIVESERWTSHFVGAAVAFAALLAIALVLRGSMGMGDVKLAGFIGLIVGFPNVLVALFASFILGGFVASVLLAAGRVTRKDPLPFGPFLSVGGMTALLAGDSLLRWWLARV